LSPNSVSSRSTANALDKCIYDHNRAFAQRSRWQRDRLLEVGELSRYDRELKEAWERFFLPIGDDDVRAWTKTACAARNVSGSLSGIAALLRRFVAGRYRRCM
jgi:hypothetical protein